MPYAMLSDRCLSYLRGWSPGDGEAAVFESLPGRMRQVLADAVEESPEFLEEYVVPALQGPWPYEQILGDLSVAMAALELDEIGLGTYEENLGELGGLGKSLLKKIGKTLKRSLNPVRATKSALKFTKREIKKEVKLTEKIARKYGPIILTVAGAVLAPFTGGASIAAASALIAVQKAYQTHAAATKAKREARKEAGALESQAASETAQAEQQVNAFYSQNQQWFIDQLGVTPDKWAQLTLQQKIDLINAGATGQMPPSGGSSQPPPIEPPSSEAMQPIPLPMPPPSSGPAPSSSGGPSMPQMPPDASGGGGSDWSQYIPQAGAQKPGSQGSAAAPEVSKSSMFGDMSGMLLPAAIVTAAVLFTGSGKKGGRSRGRSKRNPRRRGGR